MAKKIFCDICDAEIKEPKINYECKLLTHTKRLSSMDDLNIDHDLKCLRYMDFDICEKCRTKMHQLNAVGLFHGNTFKFAMIVEIDKKQILNFIPKKKK